MAIAGLVLSILGLVSLAAGWIPFVSFLPLVLSLVGTILSGLAMKKQPEKKGMAVAGLVIGIIGLVISGIFTITCTICVSCAACAGNEIVDAVSYVAPVLL